MRKILTAACGVLLILAFALASPARAQEEGGLRFEKVVPWTTGKLIDLNATVGPIKVAKVEFTDQGKGGSGLIGRIRPGASELQTTLRAAFDVENPKVDEWVVTFTLEFLDRDGKLIDRGVDKEEFEGESKVYKVDHAILEYVVPMIDKVRIKLEARYD
jgi:hypothetical protein